MSTKKTVLISAFEPFGGENINPTQLILEKLPDEIEYNIIKKILLPVEFIRSRELLFAEYEKFRPDAVIMLGQAGGRSSITPERKAKNLMNASIPDAVGYKPENEKISENGKGELYSTLPTESIVKAINDSGIPAKISDDAGAYVCNCLLYGMLERNNGEVPTGFIHVPFIKEQGHEPYMELEDIYVGITAAIKAVFNEINE